VTDVPIVKILGTAQDGGVPHVGCFCETCVSFHDNAGQLYPTSISIAAGEDLHLIDISRELDRQSRSFGFNPRDITDVWITHGHLGHVDGLGLFGREVMGLRGVRLHTSSAMMKMIRSSPRLRYLLDSGVFIGSIFQSNVEIKMEGGFSFLPVPVPHRDELSDTHAFLIRGPRRSLFHLPDHDRWELTLGKHKQDSIIDWLKSLNVDIALVDGTFWNEEELPSQAEIPHPTIQESLLRLGPRGVNDPDIRFIHINHSNPILIDEKLRKDLSGWSLAEQGETFIL
jgi:pyrroloquinoline quinone biosynthesis protein B